MLDSVEGIRDGDVPEDGLEPPVGDTCSVYSRVPYRLDYSDDTLATGVYTGAQ